MGQGETPRFVIGATGSVMTTNAIVVLAGYFVTVVSVLLWVFFSKQKYVAPTFKTAVGILLRTLPLFVVFLMICQWLAVSAVVEVSCPTRDATL